MNDIAFLTKQAFTRHFGAEPQMSVQAPGRVNLIGEHTDYNNGFVLPCAIHYRTVVSMNPRPDRQVQVFSVDYGQQDSFSLGEPIQPHPTMRWANYVRGVVKYLLEAGWHFDGLDLAISGDIPQGAGLSSSASLEVAVGKAFQQFYQLPATNADLAQIGQKAENLFVGCHCGIMDQLISAEAKEGSALLIDCDSLVTQSITIPRQCAIMVINSNVQRGLLDSENTRRVQCEEAARFFGATSLRDVTLQVFQAGEADMEPLIARRARHVITENLRVLEAVQTLDEGNLPRLGQLMAESHASMRDNFAITVPAVDTIVEIVKQVIGNAGGVRMTGGGFGGCVVALLPHNLVAEVRQALEDQYTARSGLQESIYICKASEGAGRC